MQILLRCIRNRMQHEIELSPVTCNLSKDRFKLPRFTHIAGSDDLALQRLGQRTHIGFGLLVQVRDCQCGAGSAEGFGAAIGDTVCIGDAYDQSSFSFKLFHEFTSPS